MLPCLTYLVNIGSYSVA